MKPYLIYKFGGSSVASAERIKHVCHLIAEAPTENRLVVVTSALGGVTDQLLQMIGAAEARDNAYIDILQHTRERHQQIIEELLSPEEQHALLQLLDDYWRTLTELLDGIYLVRECTPRIRDAILSTGERVAAPLLAASLRAHGIPAQPLDATAFIQTNASFGQARVDFETTNAHIQRTFQALPPETIGVVTGFIGATPEGVVTTLGRSGSDYTAAILGAALEAQKVVIWTDVSGVLSADPRLVPEAFPLRHINYQEAAEMAYFGAKVLHAHTMQPLIEKEIPLITRNTFQPDDPGTLISAHTDHLPGHVKAITSMRQMALLTLEGPRMAGIPGITARALQAVAREDISVIMVSQASSEQNLCFVVHESDSQRACQALEEAFELERLRGDITNIQIQPEVAIIAAVGENMRMRPGISGKMFSTLGKARINVIAIAQGSSERNISAVIEGAQVKRAVQALHHAFPGSRKPIHVALLGTGTVGRQLLHMFQEQKTALLRQGIALNLVGIANSRKMLLSTDHAPIPFSEALDRLASEGQSSSLETFTQYLQASHLEHLVLIDATASLQVAQQYATWLASGIAIVAANKQANTLPLTYYQTLKELARQTPFRYETNVGAGLPVIATLQQLIQTGDNPIRIEAVASGTLAYLFNQMRQGIPLSTALKEAHQAGYTEPDPREDLSGEDVARKMIILAREAGLPVEREHIRVEPLLPASFSQLSLSAFWEALPSLDQHWQEQITHAQHHNQVLTYTGEIDFATQQVSVGLQQVSPQHPIAHLKGTENLFRFTTHRYREYPLVIQGPGAGPEVTAAGVFADLLAIAQCW